MKQFIYLDTDIITSIIAQSEQGIVTQVSYENTDSEEDHDEDKVKAKAKGSIAGNLLKALKADVSIGAEYEDSFGQSYQNSTKEIIEKVLHDANFAIAYDYIAPIVVEQGNTDYGEEGNYLELYRAFDFIDFDYLRGLFAEGGVMDFIKKSEAEKIEASTKEEVEKLNREQQRSIGKNISKVVKERISENEKKYGVVEATLKMLSGFIPYKRLLFSRDGYLIPLDDKYFRIDPTHLGFKYGGSMTYVGMVTNIIGADTEPFGDESIFETVQFQANEVLRYMMPTKEKNLCVIHPIAVYYGDVQKNK